MWRYLFLCPLYLVIGSLPLLSDVGANLEYEYTLLASWLTLIAVPLFGLFLKERYLPITEAKFDPPMAFDVLWIFCFGPVVALLPGIYMFATGLCPCSESGFGFWMVVNWYPAWVLAHAAMYAIMRGRVEGLPSWKLGSAFGLILLGLVLFTAAQLWFQPQKRIMSLVAGFLHGPVYDEWIPFDDGLAMARGTHFFWAVLLLLLAWMRVRMRLIVPALICFAASLILGGLAAKEPSTLNGQDVLNKLLPGKLEGEGFTLHYRPADAQMADWHAGKLKSFRPSLRIRRLHRDAEFHVGELRKEFGSATAPHVDIYVYANDTAKKLWFGGGSTDVADVYTPSIHISTRNWPHPTLRHELVHGLASDIGFHGLGFHPNMAFTEGLAEALAPRPRTLSADDGAASLIDSKRLPSVDSLFSPAFWKIAGSRAYTAASSLLGYLIDTYGLEKVLALYGGASWEEAIEKPRDQVIKAWQDKILSAYDKERYGFLTEALYRDPGLFRDRCPHTKADYQRDRRNQVFVRLRQPIGWNPDKEYLPWLLSLDSKDRRTRLRLWKDQIENVATDRFLAEGRLLTWVEALEKARTKPAKTLEDAEMLLLQSDILRLLGKRDQSLETLSRVKALATKKYLGASLTRHIDARIRLEQTLSETAAGQWRKFLAGWRRSLPDGGGPDAPWIESYLRLRNDGGRRLNNAELEAMLEMEPDQDLNPDFHTEWYRLIAERAMLRETYDLAVRAYSKAVNVASPGAKRSYAEEVRRAQFYQKKGPLRAPSGDDNAADATN